MSDEKSVVDNVKEVLDDNETPLGEKAPGAPFAIVGLTYPILLIVGLLGVAVILWAVL